MPSATPDVIENEMHKIVPWEFWHGERFNVNRLFGNGRDNPTGGFLNGVVDEPGETGVIWPNATDSYTPPNPSTPPVDSRPVPPTFRNVPFDYSNDDPLISGPSSPWLSRQIYARQLYCLMMLLNDGFVNPVEEASLTPPQRRRLTAHRIAQWAINVVDFRDSDAIMTPFEYDDDPWDGWDVNAEGNLLTPPTSGGVVWGTEYPELLLTESTAFHDVRVKNTAEDTSGDQFPDDGPDQYRIPQGSLFLEFYCTRNRQNNLRFGEIFAPDPSFPAELYDVSTLYDEDGSLNLARTAPGGMPVWQVAISSEPADSADSPLKLRETNPDTTTFDPDRMSLISPTDHMDIERYIWFAPVDPATIFNGTPEKRAFAQRIFWNRSGVASAKVKPASYLVVGPRTETRIGSQAQMTPPQSYLPSEQRITLLPGMVQFANGTGITPPPFDYDPSTPPYSLVKPVQTMVAAANPPIDLDPAASTPAAWWTASNYNATLDLGGRTSQPPTHSIRRRLERDRTTSSGKLRSHWSSTC